MEGFYITIKNGLLDPKHIKAMHGDKDSGTIWLFLWLLDKMTIIDHEIGEGKVLGGKPVKFEDVKKTLSMSRRTYQTWLNILREGNYITTKRTPYGLIITIHKAFKVFGQKSDVKQTTHHSKRDVSLTAHLSQPQPFTSNIDNTVDSNRYKYLLGENAKKKKVETEKSEEYKNRINKEVDQILKAFEDNVGQIPSDKKPRFVAQNIRTLIHTFVRNNSEVYQSLHDRDLTFDYTLSKAWEWYAKKKYCEETEKLETFKLKMKVFLDSTSKRLATERSMCEAGR